MWKGGEKQGRPGTIHHVIDVWYMNGGHRGGGGGGGGGGGAQPQISLKTG